MNKKELRKELTLNLLKGMEEVLNKHNNKASRKIRKITLEASKSVAKKFVKALKSLPESKVVAVKEHKKSPDIEKSASASWKGPISRLPKKKIVPLKPKVKK